MENQHRKIKGYRELSQEEIDLINRVKAKGKEMLELQAELVTLLKEQERSKMNAIDDSLSTSDEKAARAEFARFRRAEPQRWASVGKTHIQQGMMALVQAIGQPDE